MNKKVLSAILFSALFAGTGTFTSCIDNDEPEGIENLRGAKAELIRAKVAVEQAEATYKLAQAELVKAQAAVQNAIAEQNKALAEYQKLVNERQEITNAEAQADLDAKIAAAELAAEQAKLDHEIAMTNLTKKLAEAKRGYEVVMAEIEIAKATLSGKERVTIYDLQTVVEGAQTAVETAENKVEAAEDDYYNATLEVNRGEVSMKRYENKVADAEAALATAQATYDMWNGLLAEDAETADWTAEITALEDTVKMLEKKQVELTVEEAKLKNSEEYKALIDAVNATTYAYNNQKTTEKYSFTDAWNAEVVTAKNTPIENAIVEIGGADWDGKGGRIQAINNRIASYTSEKIAVLELIKANYETALAGAKKSSDDAVAAWTAAKTAYADAKVNAVDIKTDTPKAAYKKYKEDLAAADLLVGTTAEATAAKIAAAKVKANQNFADALVAWYNSLPEGQVTFNKLTLPIYTYGKNSNNEIVVTKTTYTTKTVKEWLSDANDKDVYLERLVEECFGTNGFPAYWSVGAEREVSYVTAAGENAKYTTAKDAFGKIVDKDVYKATMKADLVAKSKAAFGTELLVGESVEEGFMQVVPTDAEVMAIEDYSTKCGALGNYIWMKQESTQYEAKNYETIIAKYKEAVTYWTEVLNTLVAARKEAKAAMKAAVYAKDLKDYEIYTAIYVANGDIEGRIAATNRIITALTAAVTDYLKVDYSDYDGTVKFEEWLKGKVAEALDTVYNKEDELIQAKNALTAAQDGKIDVWAQLADAEEALEEAMAELEEAQAELEEALANLAKGLEIIAATNAAE